MLTGERVRLRMVREDDLDQLYAFESDLDGRGAQYPLDVSSLTELRRNFESHGYWEKDHGTLLIVDPEDALLGQIQLYRRVTYAYWDSYEIAYRLVDTAHHGKGYMTEALRLLSDCLFASKRVNRLGLRDDPSTEAGTR